MVADQKEGKGANRAAGIIAALRYYSSKVMHPVCVGPGEGGSSPLDRLMVPTLKLKPAFWIPLPNRTRQILKFHRRFFFIDKLKAADNMYSPF